MKIEEGKDQLTGQIIGCAYTVSNALGSGFLEKVYENALVHELRKQGLSVDQQHPISVQYDGVAVGEYVADIIVEHKVLVELKAVFELNEIHSAKCLNYLNATGLKTCLLLNFGRPKVELRRLSL